MAYEDLNPEQLKAVEAGDGPILIVAGPGTGKTKTLTARIAFLITSAKAAPQEILALTFTKKAAGEMQERVLQLLAKAGIKPSPQILTFHALCHEILGGELAFADEAVRLQVIKKLAKPADLKAFSTRELGLLISRCKNMAEDNPDLKKLTESYNSALSERGLVDYDDLLVQARDLLVGDQTKREALQQRYKYILVDEFQDTNLLQYEFLRLLLGHHNIFVIGDPNQSIYGFRGASGGIFERFKQDYPGHVAVELTVNYRSASAVVGLGNAIFTSGPQLTAFSQVPGAVRAVEVLNEYSEANWVLNEIQRAVGGGDLLHTVSDGDSNTECTFRDFAVLYRSRAAAITFQKLLQESGLPYQVVGDGSPYDQPQVQTILALMRVCAGRQQTVPEGFSEAEEQAVLNSLQPEAAGDPRSLADKIISILKFEQTPGLQQFIGSLVRFKDLPAALNYFDSIAKQDFYDAQADAITLLTIHASKGLEFPRVFLIGTEEGILPHKNADPHEEKRLLYVAATRAKHNLDITYAQKRGGNPAQPSRFIVGLPADKLSRSVDPALASDKLKAKKRAAKRRQQSLF
ncbi:MAG TPA: ATP-dependent helicase [Patescibacteria group bacterium]|nr:ATP-dependent helicase [Patescibacteria group bacterium]